MAVKCTGAEYNAFIESDWENDAYMDDYSISVNGVEFNQFQEDSIHHHEIKPSDKIVILAGCVYEDSKYIRTLESHFKMWRKKQATAFLAVECPNDKLEAVKAAIVAAGGKIK